MMSDIEIYTETSVEFTLYCMNCDAELTGSHDEHNSNNYVYVEPCENCQQEAIDKAIQEKFK
jgi:hypothetical protein